MPGKEANGVAAVERKKVPVKPDQATFERELKEIDNNIEALKKQLAEAQNRISGTDIKDAFTDRRKDLREQQDALIKQRNELQDQRGKIIDQLKAIQATLRKKTDDARSSKDRLGYKSVEDVDKQISTLERQLQSGEASLHEEKRIVAEISNLKKARKILEGFSSQQSSVESDKKQLDDLRAQLDAIEPQRNEIRTKIDAVKAQLTDLDNERKSKMGSFNDLVNDRKSIKADLDAEFDKLRALKSDYKKQKDEWFTWQREEQARKREQYLARKREESEARLTAQAEREREAAEIPAYSDEINQCATLIKFLENYSSKSEATKTNSADASTTARQMETGLPEGAVLLKKKDDEEYMVLGNKKGKKGRRQAGTGQSEKVKPFKLDFDIIDQFVKLKIDLPVSAAEIPATISALEEKQKWFKDNQAEATAKAKAAAEAKIAALRRGDAASEDNTPVEKVENKVEAAAEVDASDI
ncbi:hypothetical protein SpCBS45565_g01256 [Spizellomyces sp. 'palustris']|nr:hypothetical protein SpCBS45565_g01256 [Spizellomyces sp. 'palustris']